MSFMKVRRGSTLEETTRAAISSPLLEESVEGASGILLNITGGKDLGLFEVNEAAEIIHSAADGNANTDLTVNGEDLGVWQDEYGNRGTATGIGGGVRGHVRYVTSFSAGAVPEPNAVVLAGLGLAGALSMRRRADGGRGDAQ